MHRLQNPMKLPTALGFVVMLAAQHALALAAAPIEIVAAEEPPACPVINRRTIVVASLAARKIGDNPNMSGMIPKSCSPMPPC